MMEEEDEGHMARQGEQQCHEEEEPLRCQSSRICRNDHRLQYLQGTVIRGASLVSTRRKLGLCYVSHAAILPSADRDL